MSDALKNARAGARVRARVVLDISKMKTAEKVHTDEDDAPAMVRLSDGRLATDLVGTRPLWAFEGEPFAGGKAGLREAAAEIIRRRQTQK